MLTVIFDPSSGLYISLIHWDKNYPTRSLLDSFERESRIGTTDQKLIVFTLGYGTLFAYESTDRSSSIDEAETKSLNWAAAHMTETEGRAARYKNVRIGDVVAFAPQGFLPEEPSGSAMRSAGPHGLLDLDRKDGLWELTVQGRYKGKWLIDDNYDSHGIVPVEPRQDGRRP
jgi:hypothetical protein